MSVCPSCHQELISYRDGCGVCGWQGIPVQVKQPGVILRDLGNQFEIALNDGSVGVYHKLYVYPLDGEHQPNYPLEKADATLRRRTDGAYKVRTQVPHTAPPQGNAHQDGKTTDYVKRQYIGNLGKIENGMSASQLCNEHKCSG